MYSLLIADDESWIRKGIRAKLEKHGFHFSWIREAENGEQALDIIADEHPDIVLLDIKMDRIDGVEVMKRLRQIHSRSKVIVISGYSDFAYAEHAINSGARGYLLKPIENHLFVQRLQSVMIELEQERETAGTQEEVLRVRSGNAAGDAPQNQTVSDFTVLGIVHVDSMNNRSPVREIRAKYTLRRRLIEEIKPSLSSRNASIYEDTRSESNAVFLCREDSPERAFASSSAVSDAARNCAANLGFSVTIGCSDPSPGTTIALYDRAKKALDSRLYWGPGTLYRYSGIPPWDQVENHELRFLEEHIRHANAVEIRRRVNSILVPADSAQRTVPYLYDAYIQTIRTALRSLAALEPGTEGNDPGLRADDDFYMDDSAAQLADRVSGAIEQALSNRIRREASSGFSRIDLVQQFIDQHFPQDISTQTLSKEFNVNPNYLSTIFHEKTGMTITGYNPGEGERGVPPSQGDFHERIRSGRDRRLLGVQVFPQGVQTHQRLDSRRVQAPVQCLIGKKLRIVHPASEKRRLRDSPIKRILGQ
jgi:DNA-binding NarL/FixJ family response regulator/AraC-like DNA-binding protein